MNRGVSAFNPVGNSIQTPPQQTPRISPTPTPIGTGPAGGQVLGYSPTRHNSNRNSMSPDSAFYDSANLMPQSQPRGSPPQTVLSQKKSKELIQDFFKMVKDGKINDVHAALAQNRQLANCSDDKDNSALYYAAALGDKQIVDLLLKNKADVNFRCDQKNTALMAAAEKNFYQCCDILIENGAEVNAENSSGNTALHLASVRGHLAACKSLLRNGAKLSTTNRKNLTATDEARAAQHLELYDFLMKQNDRRMAGTLAPMSNNSQSDRSPSPSPAPSHHHSSGQGSGHLSSNYLKRTPSGGKYHNGADQVYRGGDLTKARVPSPMDVGRDDSLLREPEKPGGQGRHSFYGYPTGFFKTGGGLDEQDSGRGSQNDLAQFSFDQTLTPLLPLLEPQASSSSSSSFETRNTDQRSTFTSSLDLLSFNRAPGTAGQTGLQAKSNSAFNLAHTSSHSQFQGSHQSQAQVQAQAQAQHQLQQLQHQQQKQQQQHQHQMRMSNNPNTTSFSTGLNTTWSNVRGGTSHSQAMQQQFRGAANSIAGGGVGDVRKERSVDATAGLNPSGISSSAPSLMVDYSLDQLLSAAPNDSLAVSSTYLIQSLLQKNQLQKCVIETLELQVAELQAQMQLAERDRDQYKALLRVQAHIDASAAGRLLDSSVTPRLRINKYPGFPSGTPNGY